MRFFEIFEIFYDFDDDDIVVIVDVVDVVVVDVVDVVLLLLDAYVDILVKPVFKYKCFDDTFNNPKKTKFGQRCIFLLISTIL